MPNPAPFHKKHTLHLMAELEQIAIAESRAPASSTKDRPPSPCLPSTRREKRRKRESPTLAHTRKALRSK